MPACQCCNLKESKRLELDREIVQGKSYTMLANKYGLDWQAVRRHAQEHVSHQLRTAYEKKQSMENLDLLSEIEELIRRTKRIMDQAEDGGKLNVALNAIGQARGSYELLSKIAFSLHQARLAELELEQTKTEAGSEKESEKFARQAMNRLSLEEADLFTRLVQKAAGETKEEILPKSRRPLWEREWEMVQSESDSDPVCREWEEDDLEDFEEETPIERRFTAHTKAEEPEPDQSFRRTKKPAKNSVKPIPSKVIKGGGRLQDEMRTRKQIKKGQAVE